jgi:hypothetical protein
MTKDEALKMALEVMRNQGDVSVDEWIATEKAIKEALANEALDKMAENARELGLDYEPEQDWIERERAVGYREGHQNALKQMAQPEQEPVAWAKFSAKGNIIDLLSEPDDDYTPLYTTPPQRTWVGIDVEDYIKALELCDFDKDAAFEFFETKLKEKNT